MLYIHLVVPYFRPKEFIDCVGHIRLLSWLLLGSLSHTAITKANGCITCQPIPLEASPHIADHIMVIMTGFAEQSKVNIPLLKLYDQQKLEFPNKLTPYLKVTLRNSINFQLILNP